MDLAGATCPNADVAARIRKKMQRLQLSDSAQLIWYSHLGSGGEISSFKRQDVRYAQEEIEPHLWRLLNFTRYSQSSKRSNVLSFGLYTYQHEKTMTVKSNNRLQMGATMTLISMYHYLIF